MNDMETLTCSCSKCHAVIGSFENLWDKIGKTYYSPICNHSHGLGGLAVVGDVRAAPKAGVIEHSFLQDVACQVCGEKLGLRCDTAPDGHVLIKSPLQGGFTDTLPLRDQLILRVAGMTIVSDSTGRKASLRVRRKYSLTSQQPTTKDARELRELSASLINANREMENCIHPPQTIVQPISCDTDAIPSLLRFAEWARDAIAGQRKDIDRVCSTVSRMEEDMISFRDYMSDLCKDVAVAPGGKPWEMMKNDFAALKDEVGQLRMDVETIPKSTCLNNEDSVGLSSEELEALTSSIMKINQRVNEVENLKLDLQLMKGRLKRFEDSSRDLRPPVEHRAAENMSTRLASRNSLIPPTPRRVSEGSTNENATLAFSTPQFSRKRKSDDFGENSASLKRSSSVTVSKKRMVSTELHPSTRRPSTTRKPSGLSHVQLLDDPPTSVKTSKFVDGNDSESDNQHMYRSGRDYDNGLGIRPTRQRVLPKHKTPHQEANFPDPEEGRNTPLVSRPFAASSSTPATTPSTPRSCDRALSEGLRNADSIRLTKNGMPDRRSSNFKYLKQYYSRLKAQTESKECQPERQGDMTITTMTDDGGNETDREVLPSIEKEGGEAAGALVAAGGVVADREKAKRAALEARDRLVRETLEREMEG